MIIDVAPDDSFSDKSENLMEVYTTYLKDGSTSALMDWKLAAESSGYKERHLNRIKEEALDRMYIFNDW